MELEEQKNKLIIRTTRHYVGGAFDDVTVIL